MAALAAFGVFSASGQSGDTGGPPPSRKVVLPPDTPVKASWPEINLNIAVLDKARHPVAALAKTDFQLKQDGVPQTIEAFSGPDTPVSLGLMIDVSGSTYQHRQQITDAAIALVKGLPPGSEVMAVLFADEGFLDVPFAPVAAIDPEYVVRHLESKGGTALFDSLIAANGYFASHAHEKRRAMVLISDGGEDASAKTMNDAAHAMLTYRSPLLYVLGMPNEGGKSTHAGEDRKRLQELGRISGGVVSYAKTSDDVLPLANEISAAIRGQYALTFASSDATEDGRARKLEAKVARGGAEVYGLPQYLAPSR